MDKRSGVKRTSTHGNTMAPVWTRRKVLGTAVGLAAAGLVPGAFGAAAGRPQAAWLRLSTVELARRVRAGELSSEQLTSECIERIGVVNPALNAVVQLQAEAALKEARAADRTLEENGPSGPLHGVPFTLKDSFDTAGLISTAGTLGRKSFVPDTDATVAARLKQAGAILLGKTNTPELTLSFETDNPVYGATRNPYDLKRSPGGSSGGSAAVVAAWGVPFDVGTDTAGSIRFPAHCCGLAGLKPTAGRVSRAGHVIGFEGALQSFTTAGPLARRVEDLELLLSIIAGPDGRDPHAVPAPLGDSGGVDLGGLKVAMFTDIGEVTASTEVASAVGSASESLAKAGAVVRQVRPPGLEESVGLMVRIFGADGGAGVKQLLEAFGTPEPSPQLAGMLAVLGPYSMNTAEFNGVLFELDVWRSRMLGFMHDFDLIVCPVASGPAPLPNEDWESPENVSPAGIVSYTAPFNATGWPVAVVRAGASAEGLPIGVQLVARPWREDVALRAARAIEDALGGWQAPPEAD